MSDSSSDPSLGASGSAGASTSPAPAQIECQDEPFVPYLSEAEIGRRTGEIAEALTEAYAGRRPIFVGVLNGAFMFLADLLRHLSIECEVDFLKLSSYGAEKISRGEVTELKRVDADLEGRHVVIVEDIVDTGLSMQYLLDRLRPHEPRTLRTVTLLHKPDAREHEAPLDYVGFEIPDRFVIGYGMDYGQLGRNWPAIYVRADGDEDAGEELPAPREPDLK